MLGVRKAGGVALPEPRVRPRATSPRGHALRAASSGGLAAVRRSETALHRPGRCSHTAGWVCGRFRVFCGSMALNHLARSGSVGLFSSEHLYHPRSKPGFFSHDSWQRRSDRTWSVQRSKKILNLYFLTSW